MILIGLGSNLPGAFPSCESLLDAALTRLQAEPLITLKKTSRIWHSAPVPLSDQPWYHNSVVQIETTLPPLELLERLRTIEEAFGRTRCAEDRNAARTLDLDLLTYNDEILDLDVLTLPHPRMHERGFVLYPLEEIDANWMHPKTKDPLSTLIKTLDPDQNLKPLAQKAA